MEARYVFPATEIVEVREAPHAASHAPQWFTEAAQTPWPAQPEPGRGSDLKMLLGIPSTPCEVAFHKLKMVVDTPGKGWFGARGSKTVLHEVSGIFQAGKFTAIMGSSGAGKTSLLNAVGGEASGGTLSGRITVNGQSIALEHMRRLRAFVFQDDVMLGTMTVREVITMSARLRLPESMSLAQKEERVSQVIKILHLENCAETVMGYNEASNISGGERKRVGIAIELVTNPSTIFLDEPTSGLDTFTAYTVCV
jgi:ATP-binding cassette subfamily G (WHITE) protein 1